MFGWLRKLGVPVVSVDLRGISTSFRGQMQRLEWTSINQIDVGRKPTGQVEYFYVTLHSDEASITITDDAKGFPNFKSAILDRWPDIKDAWVAVFMGTPDMPEHCTLWTRA